MLLARIAWLEGRLRWRDGRVVWETPEGQTAPGPTELSRAQRSLNKLRSYPVSAALALGDPESWLAERQARLELAKQLSSLSAPDLAELGSGPPPRDPQAISQSVRLLVAEGLCLNPLPAAPSAALLRCGGRAVEPLQELLDDETVPLVARWLAALVLGAIRAADPVLKTQRPTLPVLQRAYAWGLQAGLPPEPALVVTLLEGEDGPALAWRCLLALQDPTPFSLKGEQLRELLADGVPPRVVVVLAEAAAAAAPLAARMLRREKLAPGRAADRRAAAEQLRRQCREAVDRVAYLLHEYVRATHDPEVVRLVVRFANAMLELGSLTEQMADVLSGALHGGLDLPAELQRPYLDLLVERHPRLWDPGTRPDTSDTRKERERIGAWICERWAQEGKPVLNLLRATQDPALTTEALDLGVHRGLSGCTLREPGFYPLLLAMARQLDLTRGTYLVGLAAEALNAFPTTHAARAVFEPLTQALSQAPPALRERFSAIVFESVSRAGSRTQEDLPLLTRFLPRLIHFDLANEPSAWAFQSLVRGALPLYRSVPDQAEQWLDWLMKHLQERAQSCEEGYDEANAVEWGVPLAAVVAGGDFSCFQNIVRGALRQPYYEQQELLLRSLPVLSRFPALRAPLAHLFPQQPRRCLELLVRMGLATRLGPDALEAVVSSQWSVVSEGGQEPGARGQGSEAVVSRQSSVVSEGGQSVERGEKEVKGWAEVLEVAPELEATAAAYWRARELVGESGEVPAGVRRALDLPRRLAAELAHLEGLAASRPDLAARATNLKARLADEERLLDGVRAEVRERLTQIAAEAQLAAAEAAVLSCYRHRLEKVAGPLPPDLRFDRDLLNATLLTVDIDRNRRLLWRLLRAHLSGRRRWRHEHPANVAFLSTLEARGSDVGAWLKAHPRIYPCDRAAGGRVRLRLEDDPLHILQMGNYFDTCLSFGNCNAYSTVANACELNKRVIYATDGAGKVVGRKLIGINEEGLLVGFHTYTSMADEEGNTTLRAIFRRYVVDFAGRCRLRPGDDGTVPTLFAEAWYNDGIVPWNEDEASAQPSRLSGKHARNPRYAHSRE
jgi:hypothetical protein